MAWYNNAICDIYIGKGAGAKLLRDITNANKSVKVVSPYLSPALVKELIYLYSKGIDVLLITSDNIEDYYGTYEKNIYKLIRQEQIVDKEAESVRNRWIDSSKYLLFSIIGIAMFLLFSAYFYREIKLLYGIIPIVILIFIRELFRSKIKTKQIYRYKYHQLFPFKVYVSPEHVDTYKNIFIHGKIYIIDDEIAYMGSLNFTASGTKENYETRIRTTDPEAMKMIVKEFDDLFFYSGLPERDIQYWGSQLYKEPIN